MHDSGKPDTRSSPPGRQVQFPPYRLDLAAECLYRAEHAIPLRPKTFAVLRHLVEHPHVLLTKDDLLRAVWGDVVVSESTLTKSIGEIRRALQDDAQRPRFLETVHRRGFRFLVAAETTRRTPATPLSTVGRDDELARIHEAFQAAASGERQVVFITGEAGIGKTTLVGAFLAGLDTPNGPWMVTGQCVRQHGAHEPYMPVLEALGRLVRGPHGARLITLLRRHAPSWLVHMPWLVPPDELHELRAGLIDATRERMLRMFLQLVDELTSEAPLVLVLEDLHWADPSTLDLLAALGQRPERAALLIIGTYRPSPALASDGALADVCRTLASKRRCIDLPLDPLSPAGSEAYLARRFGGVATPDLARLLHLHTDGHPLFLVTAVDHLLAQEAIAPGPDGLHAPLGLEVIEQSIPGSLRELIEAQVQAADRDEIDVLEAASVVGVAFSAQTVAAGLETDDAGVEVICERLVREKRFLRRSAEESAWPDGTIAAGYAFVHAVYQRGLYHRLPPARRRLLHRRVGVRLEAAYGAGASAASSVIAVHCDRGDDPARAILHLSNAAVDAERRYAPRETAAHVRRALGLLEREPMSAERRRRELALRFTLVGASVQLGFPVTDDGWTNYLRARELAADESDATQLFRLLYAMFISRIGAADAATAPMLAEELGRAAERLNVDAARHVAEFSRAYVAFLRGHLHDAASLEAIRHRAPAELEGYFYGSNPVILAGAAEGFRCWLVGKPDHALAVAEETVGLARTQSHPLSLCMTLFWAAQVCLQRGDLDAATTKADEGRRLGEEFTFSLWGALHLGTKGAILARRNQPIPAAAAIGQSLLELRASGNRIAIPLLLSELADAARLLGSCEDGLARVAEGLEATEHSLDPGLRAELWRAQGEILVVEGREPVEAAACFHRAIELAHAGGATAFELRAATALAHLLETQGRHADALAVLSTVVAQFQEGFDTSDVRRARALYQRIAGPRAPRLHPLRSVK